MRPQGHFRRNGPASVLAAVLLVVALVAQAILGSALQVRAAETNGRLDAVLCLSQSGNLPHDTQEPAGQQRHSADCLASCQLSASGSLAPLAVAAATVTPDGPATPAPYLPTRSRFVLNAQAFLAAARAPPSPSA